MQQIEGEEKGSHQHHYSSSRLPSEGFWFRVFGCNSRPKGCMCWTGTSPSRWKKKLSQEPATLGGSSAERCTTCCSRNANASLGFTLEIFQKICKALIIFNISANFFFWCNHKFTIVAKRSGMNYKFQLAAKQTGIMCAVTIFSHNIPLQNWLKMRKEIVKLSLQRSI